MIAATGNMFIPKRALGVPVFSLQSSRNYTPVGAFGSWVSGTGRCGESLCHQYRQSRRSLSMNGRSNNAVVDKKCAMSQEQPCIIGIRRRHSHRNTLSILDSTFNVLIDRRRYIHSHSQPPGETQPTENKDSQQKQSVERRQTSSDPTAKRPTKKCDPYGLQGESLSYAQCLEWMSTLEDGWRLLESENDDASKPDDKDSVKDETTITEMSPKFLQNQYYHHTFHEASQFLSYISLVATNLNHYPVLSMERILVDDMNNIHGDQIKDRNNDTDSNDGMTKRNKRKIKGWVFHSTIRCSTYRPPTAGSSTSREQSQNRDVHSDKGLTYHDFHLAMSIDVEVSREELKRLLWADSQS